MNLGGSVAWLARPAVMGIINVSPESFFGKSVAATLDEAVAKAAAMLAAGASILDVGAQTTKPGSLPIAEAEELDRAVAVVSRLLDRFPEAVVSIDSYRASVAAAAVKAGARIINDIGGGTLDPDIIPMAASLRVPYICTHVQGTPATMQDAPVYGNVLTDVLDFFIAKAEACAKAGIMDLIIDPGFGFGKTIAHNYRLLAHLGVFKMVGKPILVGVSRKGMVYKPLGLTPEAALPGTMVLQTLALANGADILRVHDVAEAVQAVKLMALYQQGEQGAG